MTDTASRFGTVAVIGLPNAGKSTLINQLVGCKITAVTHKVQTTRNPFRAIATFDLAQAILIDTPGVFKLQADVDTTEMKTRWGDLSVADVQLLVVDATLRNQAANLALVQSLQSPRRVNHPVGLVLNKIDRIARERLLPIMAEFNTALAFDETIPISARTGEGCDIIRNWLQTRLPVSEWHYPADQIADAPLTAIAAEITREKAMLRLHDEIPYGLTVATMNWQTAPNASVRIKQHLIVAKETHRRMAIGKAGRTIAAIDRAARAELQELIGHSVHLDLQVKLRTKPYTDIPTVTPPPVSSGSTSSTPDRD